MKTRRFESVLLRLRVGDNKAQACGFVSRMIVRREGVSSAAEVSVDLWGDLERGVDLL